MNQRSQSETPLETGCRVAHSPRAELEADWSRARWKMAGIRGSLTELGESGQICAPSVTSFATGASRPLDCGDLFYGFGFQFCRSVMGAAVSSRTVLMRKRPSRATSY